jgi:S-adenosylmethionine hydrolase
MSDPIISLTTDFGEDSPYVAAMKGVILSINPAARLIDLSHQIPPQDVRHAAFFLAAAVPCFPADVLHLVVVDPGVGSDRALLYVLVNGHRLLVPDNGCWALLERSASGPPAVIRLAEPRYWRHPVSATFHGRDILAPVAGHLSRGVDPMTLGPVVSEWVRLEERPPTVARDRLVGEVVFVDHFGNLITNIPGEAFAVLAGRPVRITVGEHEVPRHVRTYADAEPGSLVALVSSMGTVEVAVAQGSAAQRLRADVGERVTLMVEGNA